MLPELTQDEFSAALDSVALEIVALLPVDEPPVDAAQLAQALQLTVSWDDRQQGRGRIVRLSGFGGRARGAILLKPDPRPERLQWATAHEVGESCAYQVFDRLCVDPREAPVNAREMVANQLAARLLLPRDWFLRDGVACGWDLIQLKRRYDTASHELIARRMLDFSPRIVITVLDHARRTFRKGNLPGQPPPLVPIEQTAWREAHAGGQAVVHANPLCSVQAWPIHEPEWKREILRTEWYSVEDDGNAC